MDTVSESRLREDVEANGQFGVVAGKGHGRTNLCGTSANREARDRLVDRMEDAGLEVRVDAVGNVAGRWTPASADPDAPPVASGSHLDSVPRGGIFDGPLGVYAALESVRAMQDAGVEPARPVEVVSFTEEEGTRFGPGLLGSSVAAGVTEAEEALMMRDDDGVTLREGLAEMDYIGDGTVDAAEWDAWLELHVEQGTRLKSAAVPVGVVTTVTGIAHYEATVTGEADHAGTTPMGERRDALAAAATVVEDVEQAGRAAVEQASDTAVATVGSFDVTPNATNVVPGEATMGVDVRDVEGRVMEQIADRLASRLEDLAEERPVETTLERDVWVDPREMSERCRTALAGAATDAGVESLDLHSGAAHDSMHVARVTDAGMLFAPSRDGVSHNPREWTDWADCAAATRVLAGALASLAAE
jgi:N-carbamoyl-L-amino-acid hydrolase